MRRSAKGGATILEPAGGWTDPAVAQLFKVNPPAKNRISRGVIVGAAVSGIVGIIVTISALVFLMHRRKGDTDSQLNKTLSQREGDLEPVANLPNGELEADRGMEVCGEGRMELFADREAELHGGSRRMELPGDRGVELHGRNRGTELPGDRGAELPADEGALLSSEKG